VVEGIEKDRLLVRFTHIAKFDLEREFSFVLDVSNRLYKGLVIDAASFCSLTHIGLVLTTTPLLPNLPILVDQLNESRDVYAFIRQVRSAFQDLAGS
jgi:kinetochore protein Spc25, fungi type